MIKRILKSSLRRSFFLFGPRQTGKSTYVKALLKPEDLYISLLPEKIYFTYLREPGIFRQEILAHYKKYPSFTCVVDEIQKLPALLDEVHDLIETLGVRFILTGSSARKLRRGAANLLAGRASTYTLHPLIVQELGASFELERALRQGMLPYLWSELLETEDEKEFLQSYANTYLREEIQAEGIVRNIGPFTHFLDIVANNDGEIVNYSNVARECGVSVKTAQEYYKILEDTFLAHRVNPWVKSVRKRLVAHPRYYLFDMGVTNALCYRYEGLDAATRGRRFEQFIITQLFALNAYCRLNYQFFFWRTNIGTEVDLIIVREQKPIAAIEIKSSVIITVKDTYGLMEFCKEYPEIPGFVVCTTERTRLLENGITILPWKDFLDNVFDGSLF